jgi:predicted ATPase
MATTKAPRKKKEKIKRPDLKIGIKDFGPIAEGEIELKPLTVFIGPNNSGKSYAAMLIHSIFESYSPASLGGAPFFAVENLFSNIENNKILKEVLSELEGRLNNLKIVNELQVPNEITLPEEITQKIAFEGFKEIYEKRLSNAIEDSYACQLSDLIMFGKENFSLNIQFNSCSVKLLCKDGKLNVGEFPQSNTCVNAIIKISEGFDHVKREKIEGREFLIEVDGKPIVGWLWNNDKGFIPSQAIGQLSEFLQFRMLQEFMFPCYYLPAARSGILQGHRALAAGIIRKAKYSGIERQQEIPKFPGVVSDFISSILELRESKGTFNRFTHQLEDELIKGSIDVRFKDKETYPEIRYKFHGVEIPLHRSSSSVTELAPIFLYLKYIVKRGNILIIEEPEAHLHPGNIRILAKYLVRLVKKGVNVLITTHNEYLLEQLDNLVMLSSIDPKERVERYGYEKGDFLKHTDFAVYEFHYDQNTGTSKIEKARLTKKDGVSQDEFVKVFEELYEETDKLRRDLSDE